RALPFQFTCDPLTNPRPVSISDIAALPAAALVGLRLEMPGIGLPTGSTKNGMLFELPPPGDGFTTVTLSVPADATSVAVIEAVSCDALTKVVARSCPFQTAVETPATKPVPLTVNVN